MVNFSGKNNPNFGKKHSLEVRKRISDKVRKAYNEGRLIPINLGKHLSEETKRIISNKNKGKHMSPSTEFKRGHKTWIKDKTHSIETRRKLSLKRLNKKYEDIFGENKAKDIKLKQSINRKGKVNLKEKNGSWNGGSSFKPYDLRFDNMFREAIKIRDNDSCMICGSDNRLSIHHIDYNKSNTIKENAILLCGSCHMKTNFNREHWIKFFQSMLNGKYGYDYKIIFEIKQ